MDSAIGGFLVADIRGVNSKAVFGIFARVGVTRAGESPREVLRPPDPEKILADGPTCRWRVS